MSQASLSSGRSGKGFKSDDSARSGGRKDATYYPEEYSAAPSKPSAKPYKNDAQTSHSTNPNRMFAQVQKLYKEIKKDQQNLKKQQGIRSFSNLKKGKIGGISRNFMDMDGKAANSRGHNQRNQT